MAARKKPRRLGVYVKASPNVKSKLRERAKMDGFTDGEEYLGHLIAAACFVPVTLDLRLDKVEGQQPELKL